MSASLNTAIPLIIIGLVLFVIAIWLIMRLGQSTTVVGDGAIKRDVLDEGAAPAQRNQALIDAAPAVQSKVAVAVEETPAPVPAAPAPMPTPAPEATPAPAPAPAAKDDLRQIKGVGPKLVTMLADEGVTTFAQVAAWTDSDVAKIDAKLGRFSGRITRDQWVEQAKMLISGDKDAYAAKFGNNG
ncbi:MAG: hypothetical protein AAF251_09780 [Pseudomonadota bacterium]